MVIGWAHKEKHLMVGARVGVGRINEMNRGDKEVSGRYVYKRRNVDEEREGEAKDWIVATERGYLPAEVQGISDMCTAGRVGKCDRRVEKCAGRDIREKEE